MSEFCHVGEGRRIVETDAVVVVVVVIGALGSMGYLVWWSRRTIERIARKGPSSAREILRDLEGDE